MKTNYNDQRKQELREALERHRVWRAEVVDKAVLQKRCVKSFTKAEFYRTWKHARAINARVDESKVLFGPIFKLIEEEVFKVKHFIKHVPIDERPKYIQEMCNMVGVPTAMTDATAYESSFTPEVMSVERELYAYMTEHLPDGREFMDAFDAIIMGDNTCWFKYFRVVIKAIRMSGEMNTSLGNGFMNLMLLLFIAQELKFTVNPVVEGDDGQTIRVGEVRDEDVVDLYTRLGFNIKLEVVDSYNEGSFCGMIFDPDDLINIGDPTKYISSFAWVGKRYIRAKKTKILALLRCKAMSLAYQFRGAPVLGALAQFGLNQTRHVSSMVQKMADKLDFWEKHILLEAMDRNPQHLYVEPPIATRLLCEKIFGVTVAHQVRLEKWYLSQDTLSNVPFGVYYPACNREDLVMWDNYVARGCCTMGRLVTGWARPAEADEALAVFGSVNHSVV